MPEATKLITKNRKAWHDFFIEETFEAGLALTGTEVKCIRAGRVNLKDSYGSIQQGEIFVQGMHISPYEQGNLFNVDPMRARKLLLHRAEIRRLAGYVQMKGLTLIPLTLYLKNGRVKMEIAVAKGKKLYDKRETLAKRSADRDIERAFRDHQR